MQLPNKDSSGHDNVSNRLLKQLVDSILEPLTTVFNKSLNEGVFPQGMKEADVIPLFKAKEHYLVTNYRPISLLLTVSKLLEKTVYIRTYRFLNENGQFYQGQYGFRSGHSCQNAISELVGTVAKNMEEKKFTIGVFIDLSKAFDTLCHSILLDKMEKYGIRGNIWQWFRDYLKHRSLRVKCISNSGKMEYSSYHELDYGTPQGTCLGPLLFIIFINDLPLGTEHCLSLLFADDTTLLHSHQNLGILKTQLEQDIHTLMDWFKANKLTLNLSKTEVVLFSAQTTSMDVTLNIGIHQLKLKNHVKFLGMWLDSKLNWRKHTTTLLIKLKQNVNMLKLSNKFLDKYTKKQIYHAHRISHVLNGLLLWGNALDETSLSKIQGIMDKCFTICTGLPPTISNYTMEKMLTLRELTKDWNHSNLVTDCIITYYQKTCIDSYGQTVRTTPSKRLMSTTLDIDYYQHYLKHKVSHITKISNFNVLKHMKEFLWKSGNQGPWKLLYGELRKPSMTVIVSLLTLQCP